MSDRVDIAHAVIPQTLLSNTGGQDGLRPYGHDSQPPAANGSWGLDTVRLSFHVSPGQCDLSSSLWSMTSSKNLRDDMPEADTLSGFHHMPLPHGLFTVRVRLYSARNICHLEFPSARFLSADRRDLLPPDALSRVARIIIEDLHAVVWPIFMPITEDGEILWDEDWATKVRVARIDIARNFIVDDPAVVKASLAAIKSRYQKAWTIDGKADGGWTIANRTESSGRDRFYDKDAEMRSKGLPDVHAEDTLASDSTLFRFETQVEKSRLAGLGMSRLSDVNATSAWEALEARWEATRWGSPLPGKGEVADAVSALSSKQQMELIGFMHMAEVGADVHMTDWQRRRMRELARECGLTPGVPVAMLGEPTTRLDLRTGTVVLLDDEEAVA